MKAIYGYVAWIGFSEMLIIKKKLDKEQIRQEW